MIILSTYCFFTLRFSLKIKLISGRSRWHSFTLFWRHSLLWYSHIFLYSFLRLIFLPFNLIIIILELRPPSWIFLSFIIRFSRFLRSTFPITKSLRSNVKAFYHFTSSARVLSDRFRLRARWMIFINNLHSWLISIWLNNNSVLYSVNCSFRAIFNYIFFNSMSCCFARHSSRNILIVFKSNQHSCDVIKRFLKSRSLKNSVYRSSQFFMNRSLIEFFLGFRSFPDSFINILVF